MTKMLSLGHGANLFYLLVIILAVLTAAKTTTNSDNDIQELDTKLERMYYNNNDNNRELTELVARLSQLYNSNSGDEDGNAQTEEAEEKQGADLRQ